MHEHFKYVFSLYLVYRPIKASCTTVWPNQKVSALLDRKCSQLKFNTRLKQLPLFTTSDHYRVRALSWMCGQCIDCKGGKKWPHTLARRRETVMFGHGGSEVLVWRKKSQAQTLSIHTLASLIGNVGEGFPPPAAVILISWVSRDETPVTYCLIICTSPEINFDVKCLWVGGSGGGEEGGQLYLWPRCLPHAAISKRKRERRIVWHSHPHIVNEESLTYF